jgi:hypothetical protein
MIIIFGFVRVGETGYSEISFVKENSGGAGAGEPSLDSDLFIEIEGTKGIHYVDRVGDAIRVLSNVPLKEIQYQLNKAFMKVYGITPSYMMLSDD